MSPMRTSKKLAGECQLTHKPLVFRALQRNACSPPVPAPSGRHLAVSRLPYRSSSKPLSRRLLRADRCPPLSRLLAECYRRTGGVPVQGDFRV
jgi:hypothetical protein